MASVDMWMNRHRLWKTSSRRSMGRSVQCVLSCARIAPRPLPTFRRRFDYAGFENIIPADAGGGGGVTWIVLVRRPLQESAVPKSHVRKKKVYTPPAELRPEQTASASRRPSPLWVPVTAVSLITLGIAWLVVYYLTNGFLEVGALEALYKLEYWNLAIGFGCMVAALGVLSRWK
jgi:hypothetical protein